ncbi:36275_t:CDS:2 [Gigaspora margarita]|uniref:36275_t:CDS:1 n=1 Tax=Gigaspora margarita TaxID=4874 RepID=A0ABN7V445_GIGMA|nr:36275_t:CDS:2 [Gigaspora margarita]
MLLCGIKITNDGEEVQPTSNQTVQPTDVQSNQAIDNQVIPITKEPGPVDPCFLCGIKISSDSKKGIIFI